MEKVALFTLTVLAVSSFGAGFTNVAFLFISAILFMTSHGIVAVLLILIAAVNAWNEYGFSFCNRIQPCPGCVECDPQAFIGDDGEIHPGL